MHVRHHPVFAPESRRPRELIGRHDTAADDHDVGRVLAACLGQHRAHAAAAGIAVQRPQRLIAVDAHALARVLGLVERGDLGAGHATHHASGHLEHGHLQAEPACGGGHLQPDVAAADDHHAPSRGALGADAVGIGNGAQVVHAGQVGAWRREPARTTAGSQHQCVVGQHQPVIEPHVLLARRDLAHAPPELSVHLAFGEELRRSDEQPLALERAGQVFLRQRRALVRQPRLIAHHRQLSRKALAAQGIDGLHGGLPAPRDHDLLEHLRAE